MRFTVYAALFDDLNQGYIWLDGDHLFREVIKITNAKNKKSIYCVALNIEGNFRCKYNDSNTFKLNESKKAIVISQWYREGLGVDRQEVVDLEICRSDDFFKSCYWKMRACQTHPELTNRVAFWLGISGVFFGLVPVGDLLWRFIKFVFLTLCKFSQLIASL